jgi:hypothetical protein
VAAVALLASATAGLAAPVFIVTLGAPTPAPTVCVAGGLVNGDDPAAFPTTCAIKMSGPLTSPAGTYGVTLTVDVSSFSSSTPCFAPVPGKTNDTEFDTADGSIDMTIDTFCMDLTNDGAGSGPVSGTFTVTSGSCKYNGATGNGTFTGSWIGPSPGSNPFSVKLAEFDFIKLTTTPVTCGGGGGGGPGPGATPELDSLLLFGSGLAGGVSYLLMRRRAQPKKTV